jgi:hypothetical protein
MGGERGGDDPRVPLHLPYYSKGYLQGFAGVLSGNTWAAAGFDRAEEALQLVRQRLNLLHFERLIFQVPRVVDPGENPFLASIVY